MIWCSEVHHVIEWFKVQLHLHIAYCIKLCLYVWHLKNGRVLQSSCAVYYKQKWTGISVTANGCHGPLSVPLFEATEKCGWLFCSNQSVWYYLVITRDNSCLLESVIQAVSSGVSEWLSLFKVLSFLSIYLSIFYIFIIYNVPAVHVFEYALE